jgi:hypothetical protein
MPLPTPKIEDYRHLVDHHEIAWIPMKDGRRLAACLVIPKDAEINPVPVILEYIPYRRRDGTRVRDEETCTAHFKRGEWDARVETETLMRSDRSHFYLSANIKAFDRGKLFIERKFEHSFKRDFL